jgi:lipoprotein-anchoring transpeptidase ErfK/SrfK
MVRNRLAGFNDPVYGVLAFGTTARSATLTDWPGGGFIGIHGTSRPEILPGRVSHGCIRMRNADILRLDRRMPVGTPVSVR